MMSRRKQALKARHLQQQGRIGAYVKDGPFFIATVDGEPNVRLTREEIAQLRQDGAKVKLHRHRPRNNPYTSADVDRPSYPDDDFAGTERQRMVAHSIMGWLSDNMLGHDTTIYSDAEWHARGEAGHGAVLIIASEGPLYSLLNYIDEGPGAEDLEEAFATMLERHQLYYEDLTGWAFGLYPIEGGSRVWKRQPAIRFDTQTGKQLAQTGKWRGNPPRRRRRR